MASRIHFSEYGFITATLVWTLEWLLATGLALERVKETTNSSAIIAVAAAVSLAGLGCWVTVRVTRKRRGPVAEVDQQETQEKAESWFRRITGWFAAAVLCTVAVAWNIAVSGCVFRLAHEGSGWSLLFLVPWSLIGWFLMVVLFVTIGMVIDGLADMICGQYPTVRTRLSYRRDRIFDPYRLPPSR